MSTDTGPAAPRPTVVLEDQHGSGATARFEVLAGQPYVSVEHDRSEGGGRSVEPVAVAGSDLLAVARWALGPLGVEGAALDGDQLNRMSIVECIMRAPLDQAVAVAVGRASTCWEYPDGMGGRAGVFDDQTARQLVDALLARIQGELAVEAARASGMNAAAARIPTVEFPTRVVERGQCLERLRLEGSARHSQCLLLEGHGGGEHQNGDLRWRRDTTTGEITAWIETSVYQTTTLGELLRSQGVALTIPHLPADNTGHVGVILRPALEFEAEPAASERSTFKSAPVTGLPHKDAPEVQRDDDTD